MLWSDESKFNLCNSDGDCYVHKLPNTRYDLKYTIGMAKHGGSNPMVWGSISWHDVGPLHQITGIMDQVKYREILQEVMLPFAEDTLTPDWIFQ